VVPVILILLSRSRTEDAHFVRLHCQQRLAICSGWLLKTYLSTVTKRNSEDKTFYLHVIQPLQIAFVTGWAV